MIKFNSETEFSTVCMLSAAMMVCTHSLSAGLEDTEGLSVKGRVCPVFKQCL